MTAPLFATQRGVGTPRVVFLHGLFGQGKNWATIADGLGDEGPSLLMDLPNHGRSPWTDDLGYTTLANLVAVDLRQRLGADASVVVVGHSMGGKVAMALALRHPALVRALVVVDIAPDDSSHGYGFGRLIAALQSLDLSAIHDRGDADQALATAIPDASTRAFLLQNLQRTSDGWRWRMNLNLIAERLHGISGWPAGIQGVYTKPTLWLRGANSDYVRAEHAVAMRALFPSALLVTIKGAGHWVNADQPEAVISALRTFLASLRPAINR